MHACFFLNNRKSVLYFIMNLKFIRFRKTPPKKNLPILSKKLSRWKQSDITALFG